MHASLIYLTNILFTNSLLLHKVLRTGLCPRQTALTPMTTCGPVRPTTHTWSNSLRTRRIFFFPTKG